MGKGVILRNIYEVWYKHSFKTGLCFSWKIEKIDSAIFPCGRHYCVPYSTTPWDTKTETGTHYVQSHSNTSYDLMTERYTSQCLTAPHRTTERGIHCSVSAPHRTITWQCRTEPHRTTWRQREAHITVSPSTTSYDLTTERGTRYSVSQHHIVRPDDRDVHITAPHMVQSEDRKKINITMSHRTRTVKSKRQAFANLRCPALSSSSYIENNICFQKFRMPVCRFTCNAWFPCNKFLLHWAVWFVELTHIFLSLFGVLMLRWVWKGLYGHCLFWLKHGNHLVKIPVAFLGKFHR